MIKFTFEGKNGPVMGLGLNEENFRCLKNGDVILVEGVPLIIYYDIIILYGETKQSIAKMLSPYIDSDKITFKKV